MPVYSGAQYYATFNGGASIAALVDNLKAAVVNAGWSVVSGSSGDWKLESAATAFGLRTRVRIFDPGSGSSARVYCLNAGESLDLSGQPIYMLPNGSETWHLYANPYFCAFHVLPWPGTARKFGMFGTGFVPAFFNDGSAGSCIASIIQTGNSRGDAVDLATTFSSALEAWKYGAIWNAGALSVDANGASVGDLELVTPRGGSALPTRWGVDDSFHVSDPLLQWSALGNADSTDLRVRLILYDAIVVAGQFNAGTVITWDAKQWIAVTHGLSYGSLFFLKP